MMLAASRFGKTIIATTSTTSSRPLGLFVPAAASTTTTPPPLTFSSRLFSSSNDNYDNKDDEGKIVYHGVVASYKSKSGYGFIKVNDTNETVFVYRDDIVTNVALEKLPHIFPYLRRGETVQFELHSRVGKPTRKAKQVKYANNTIIPAIRVSFLKARREKMDKYVGREFRKIASNDKLSPEEKTQRLNVLWDRVQQHDQDGKDYLIRLGLNPDDFIGPYVENEENENEGHDNNKEDGKNEEK